MAKAPRISIIVPSLNQGRFLERTIVSILSQNYIDAALIIIDGGSSDNTIEVINKYEKYLDYWASEEDRGQAHALNKGLGLSTGDFVGWMNADDVYLPNTFKEFTRAVGKSPGHDIYYANKINIDVNGSFVRKVTYARPAQGFMKFYAQYRGMTFCSQATFFKSKVFDDVGQFDERFDIGMDMDYFYRCIIAKKKFHYTNSVWGAWRYHGASKTSTDFKYDKKRLEERALFLRKHNLYRGLGHKLLSLSAGAWRRLLLATQ